MICTQMMLCYSLISTSYYSYEKAEQIDAQLKRMTSDLKDVIEHLNTASGSQDSTDPVCRHHLFSIHVKVFTVLLKNAGTSRMSSCGE